jgi:hypothetical protein
MIAPCAAAPMDAADAPSPEETKADVLLAALPDAGLAVADAARRAPVPDKGAAFPEG